MVMNLGAITGAMLFGPLSDRFGRRRTIAIASLLALPVLPLWVFAPGAILLGIGAFAMQVSVQGAWAIVPAHLNELSPPAVRAMFPGFVYQLGNLLASGNAVWQAGFAERHGDDYAMALAVFAAVTAVALAIWVLLGPERSGGDLHDAIIGE